MQVNGHLDSVLRDASKILDGREEIVSTHFSAYIQETLSTVLSNWDIGLPEGQYFWALQGPAAYGLAQFWHGKFAGSPVPENVEQILQVIIRWALAETRPGSKWLDCRYLSGEFIQPLDVGM